jgi:hypothetical protein
MTLPEGRSPSFQEKGSGSGSGYELACEALEVAISL